ncbi:DNA-processing protein DprA, partial [Planktothrix sp.]|uniref:DNA-processing protein DprA n=1 Tax=Planktothrix sp. TaxID=3088171 RepID=UPI0038D46BE7
MNHPILSPDTQAILLLCASFGQNRLSQPQPLTLTEYNLLVGWLQDNQMRPGDLLSSNINNKLQNLAIEKLDIQRIQALLERGVMLSLAVEKWTTQGLWIMGRGDSQYPKRLKQRLKQKAPAILYGTGNIELLSAGGLAIVGARDITEQEIDYTQTIAKTCAEEGIQVISGGARGVDQISMLGILEAGGTAVGVLADSLIKTSVNGKYRNSIAEGRLTLISPYDPNAGFNTGNAMGRNKYIYALADYGLIVSSGYQTGGTWAGATEALSKIKDVPVFVRMQDTIPEGNQQLVKQGAKPFGYIPASSLRGLLRTVLEAVNSEVEAI